MSVHSFGNLPFGHALSFQPPCHVAGHRLPWEQRELLEHHAAVGPRPVHLPAVDLDRTGLGLDEAAHDVKQRALAAAARADDGDELAVAHDEALHVEHRQAAAVLAEALGTPEASRAMPVNYFFSRATGQPWPER